MRKFYHLVFFAGTGFALQNSACGSVDFPNPSNAEYTGSDQSGNAQDGIANTRGDGNTNSRGDGNSCSDPNLAGDANGALAGGHTCVAPPANLVSWWRGEGNPNDSVGPNNGTYAGAYAAGVVGQGFHFAGLNTPYFMSPTAGLPAGTSPRTIEMWARMDSNYTTPGYQGEFAGYGAYGQLDAVTSILIDYVPGNILCYSQWGYRVADPKPFPVGTWVHVALTLSTEGAILYVNGQPVSDASLPFSTPSGTTFYIGGAPAADGVPKFLNGMVDEVSVYSRELTAGEIQGIYNAGSAGKCLTP